MFWLFQCSILISAKKMTRMFASFNNAILNQFNFVANKIIIVFHFLQTFPLERGLKKDKQRRILLGLLFAVIIILFMTLGGTIGYGIYKGMF